MASGEIGLTVPPLSDPRDAVVDIVFVHGLNGDRRLTWTDDTVFWPQDLLKEDIGKARILSFGYRAGIMEFWGEPSENRIENHADDLVAALAALRTQTRTTEYPIIFVAHSLGGLICQQAILSASNRKEEGPKNIAYWTRRIAFLGTPHDGSEAANWAESGRRFFAYFKETNKTLLKELQKGSATLEMLGREFPNLLRVRAGKEEEIEIMCFFEGKSMNTLLGKIRIVPEASAVLKGYPNLSLHEDHSSMCKYDEKDNESYQKVKGVLNGWVEALQNSGTPNAGRTTTIHASYSGEFYGTANIPQAIVSGGEPHFGGGNFHFYKDHRHAADNLARD